MDRTETANIAPERRRIRLDARIDRSGSGGIHADDAQPAGAAMTSALIVNPRSGKKSGKGLALAEKLNRSSAARVVVIDDFAALPAILASLAVEGVDTLFISSGDGTIQAIQTELAERNPFAFLPRLALLPHGTTNMTAADLGFGMKDIDAQARVIADPEALLAINEIRHRPTLRIANPRDGRVRHGMFIGAGAIWQATKFCQDAVHRTGLKGDWATFATLATATGRILFTRPDPGDVGRIDRPHAMRVTADGTLRGDGEHLAFIATTLNKLVLGSKPFWGGGGAPIRSTLFAYPPPNLVRWLIPVLFGGEDRTPPPGTRSFAAGSIDVVTASSFVIDGEFFDPPEQGPLHIETGPQFAYICRR